uniref:Uncharacterized protein n=1 Tax=Oncorhynchus kisutch TaxID=8019 RepID=A0A8C7G6W9_ONCKI
MEQDDMIKDEKDGNYSQVLDNVLDNKLREVLERQKKNMHTKIIGCTVGMSKKK